MTMRIVYCLASVVGYKDAKKCYKDGKKYFEGRKLIEQKQLTSMKEIQMRHSGRENNQLRDIVIEKDFIQNADSSVLISFGKTKVICLQFLRNPCHDF